MHEDVQDLDYDQGTDYTMAYDTDDCSSHDILLEHSMSFTKHRS